VWQSCWFVVEAHRFVADVVEVIWFLACFASLCCLALGR
jgi:hypothetical protein